MNVVKMSTPQAFLRSCDQCLFHLEQVDKHVGFVPHPNLPQDSQGVVCDCHNQPCSQFDLMPRPDTRRVNSPTVLSSLAKNPQFASDQEDKKLLQRVAMRGDDALDAFTMLYHRHHEKLSRFCSLFLKSSARVEEVTQEVWLDVWTEAGTYKGEAKVTTWMFGRAKNHCYNKWRKEEQKDLHSITIVNAEPGDVDSRSSEISVLMIECRDADKALEPSMKMEAKDRYRLLRNAIATLPLLDQAILHLVYREGKSMREVSQILGRPEGTIKRHLCDTRRILRKELGKLDSIQETV